jgi:hypothetical protein
MKSVSTGVGLCVLGVCVLGASLTSVHKFGTDAVAAPPTPIGQQTPSADTDDRLRKMFQTSFTQDSRTCDSASWFDPIPLPFDASCGNVVTTPIRTADVNGDGIEESFDGSSIPLIYGGPWNGMSDIQFYSCSECLIYSRVTVGSSGASAKNTSVFASSAGPGSWAAQLWDELGISNDTDGCLDSWSVAAGIEGWADCDGDGDLDLVVRLTAYHRPRSSVLGQCRETDARYLIDRFHWFRNVGFQKAPAANRYDLDGNGHVNTADLSLMLMEFTD